MHCFVPETFKYSKSESGRLRRVTDTSSNPTHLSIISSSLRKLYRKLSPEKFNPKGIIAQDLTGKAFLVGFLFAVISLIALSINSSRSLESNPRHIILNNGKSLSGQVQINSDHILIQTNSGKTLVFAHDEVAELRT